MEENEKETPTETGKETPTENTNEGDKSKGTSIIEQGNATAERIEKANAETKHENERREKIIAEERLGGRARMGQAPIEKSEDDKKVDNAKEFFKGTALGEAIGKANE